MMLPHLRKVFDSIWTLEIVGSHASKALSVDGQEILLRNCTLKTTDIEEMMMVV